MTHDYKVNTAMSANRLFPDPTLTRRYNRLTIVLLWATALIVIFLFASSQIWEQLTHGTSWPEYMPVQPCFITTSCATIR